MGTSVNQRRPTSGYIRDEPVTTNDVLYALSTLAQTCAALAAFVGAVGIFRLQILREQRKDEDQTRRLYVYATRGPGGKWTTPPGFGPLPGPADEIEQKIRDLEREHPDHPAASAHRRWEASARPLRHSRKALLFFEGWNLLFIGASLVGFNYVALLVSSPWTFWAALWVAAVGTVAVTGYCVYAWTKD